MNKITLSSIKADIEQLERQNDDKYINVSKICAEKQKDFKDFYKLKKTRNIIKNISNVTNIQCDKLVYEIITNDEKIFMCHERVVFHLLCWLDSSFICKIENLLFTEKTKSNKNDKIKKLSLDNKQLVCENKRILDENAKLLDANAKLLAEIEILKNKVSGLEKQINDKDHQSFANSDNTNNDTNEKNDSSVLLRKLRLESGTTIEIEQRTDGYINATKLCKAGGKLFADYSRLKNTKVFINELFMTMGIPISMIIVFEQHKSIQRTWIHPQVAINLAQWINAKFAVQVTKWIFELLTKGSITLGEEQSTCEIMKMHIETIEKELQKQKSMSSQYEKEIEKIIEEKQTIIDELNHTKNKHNKLLKKQKHNKLSIGNCFYLVRSPIWIINKYKFGIADNINLRIQSYRTFCPEVILEYIMYVQENKKLEEYIKKRFAPKLEYANHEIVIDINIDDIIQESITFCLWNNYTYTILPPQVINTYNQP